MPQMMMPQMMPQQMMPQMMMPQMMPTQMMPNQGRSRAESDEEGDDLPDSDREWCHHLRYTRLFASYSLTGPTSPTPEDAVSKVGH
jgi:hypothetical protein